MDMQPAHQLVCTEIEGREFLFSNAAYDAETEIARKIASMLMFSHRTDVDYSEYLNDIQRENNLEYDEMQREAILGAMANGVFILTGGPGTGKTTTLKRNHRADEKERDKRPAGCADGKSRQEDDRCDGRGGFNHTQNAGG